MLDFSINQLEPLDLINDRKSNIIVDTISSVNLPHDHEEINLQVNSNTESIGIPNNSSSCEREWDNHLIEYMSGLRNDRPRTAHPNPMHASNFF